MGKIKLNASPSVRAFVPSIRVWDVWTKECAVQLREKSAVAPEAWVATAARAVHVRWPTAGRQSRVAAKCQRSFSVAMRRPSIHLGRTSDADVAVALAAEHLMINHLPFLSERCDGNKNLGFHCMESWECKDEHS